MSAKTADIHSFKLNGARATWKADSNNIHVLFSNNVQRHFPIRSVVAVATNGRECMVQLNDQFELASRSNKTRDNCIATFVHPEGTVLFLAKLRNKNITHLDLSDCPSLELANGATVHMHDDGVAWSFGSNCFVCLFSKVTGAVFQRIQGGSSTFDILFIGEQCMNTVEYVPHSVLENWVDYLPEHVHKMTSGADPVNMAFLRSKLAERENLLDVASARYSAFFDKELSDDEGEDDDSEYNPEDQSSTDEESDMDSEFSDES